MKYKSLFPRANLHGISEILFSVKQKEQYHQFVVSLICPDSESIYIHNTAMVNIL